MRLRVKALLSGLATYLPGYPAMRATGGTDSARYCYSVWLRHLSLARAAGSMSSMPRHVAELGPGDSIGIGLAALLSGVDTYFAFDVVRYSDLGTNLAIFDELVEFYRQRAPIPGDAELPFVNPKLQSYEFPHALLDDDWLKNSLDPARIADIRASVAQADAEHSRIRYRSPWTDPSVVCAESVDMIYSQAVLEHVTDIAGVYRSMHRWLKHSGFVSHQIDYRCHGKADTWNGHWTYSDTAWTVVVGRRPYLLNREPHSQHLQLLRETGFNVISETLQRAPSTLRRQQLAPRFRGLSEDDLTTCGAHIVAVVAPRESAAHA
jgi:SAM-dependent methyltransferase